MLIKSTLLTVLGFGLALTCIAQQKTESKPIERDVLRAYIGIWDAEIEVWPQGPESPSIKFEGVETNRPYGEYWIASDFDSEVMGQTLKVHSIVGYDLDQKKMVGTVIDHGPYAASMTGDYDKDSKTVRHNKNELWSACPSFIPEDLPKAVTSHRTPKSDELKHKESYRP